MLKDSDSLSLAAGEICGDYCNISSQVQRHHSKLAVSTPSTTFRSLSVTANENVLHQNNNEWQKRTICETRGIEKEETDRPSSLSGGGRPRGILF